jgi:hypothetical protein
MQSHQVLRESFEKTSPKALAAELGVSLSLVYKWAEPQSADGSGSRNPLDRVATLMQTTGSPQIIEWLCRQAGGYFVPNPKPASGKVEVLPATHEIVGQFAELLSKISTAAMDHEITTPEAADIRRSWDALKSYTEGFVRCCEEGDFSSMKQILPRR